MKRLVTGVLTGTLVTAMAALSTAGGTAGASPRASSSHSAPAAASDSTARAAADRLVTSKPAIFKGNRNTAFHVTRVYSSQGLRYVSYERSYKGLPVVGGDFVVSTDANNAVVATSVAQRRPTHLRSAQPTVSKTVARTKSAALVRHAALGRTRLVVLQRSSSRLAWESSVTGKRRGEPSRLTVYVDARTGRVLTSREHVMEGTGNGNWEGNVTFPTTQTGATFSMNNPNATGLACQNLANNQTYTGPDDVWGDGVGTNRETGCVDAYYGAEQERLMLQQWLGRNGMKGNGAWVPIRVGLNAVNAFYDGVEVQIGHRQANNQWIGATDVVAHEFGHGVDDFTPGSISAKGTQEFIADTFGASTEAFANNPADPPDYLVGEEINLVGSGPIRNMYNPSALGDPNCYSASIPNTEVHAAAGPGNHWYYLAAEGSTPGGGKPNSPTCNSSSVTGIGIQKVQTILYNAMLLKTTASSYLKYRTWTLTAAKNLYPGCAEFNVIKAAWDAVSVPAQAADPTCTTTSPVVVANPGNKVGKVGVKKSFTVTATGGTPPYAWSATGLPPGMSINASTGKVSGTQTTAGTFSVTVTATDSLGATGSATFSWKVNP